MSGPLTCTDGLWRVTPPTTTAAPTTTVAAGSRTNPLAGTGLVGENWTALTFAGPFDIDPAAIIAANQFNDPAPPGQKYVQVLFSGTWSGADAISGYEVTSAFRLVGAKSKVYDTAFISDVDGKMTLIHDQPDVIAGGTMAGAIIYLVDSDDSDFLITTGDKYIRPVTG